MKRVLISFATSHYQGAQANLTETAAPWFDEIRPFHSDTLPESFRALHADLFRYRRGYAFWIWKPWLILRELRTLAPGDVLMYCDAQLAFVADPAPLFDLCVNRDGILLFHQRREEHVNRTWTRRDCFEAMGCDESRYWNGPQLNAAMQVYSPTPRAFAFIEEWYQWNSRLDVVGDAVSEKPEFPDFKDHRHDQSILSLMAIRDGLDTMPDPSQFGNGYNQTGRTYKQILEFRRNVSACYPIPCRQPG